MIVLVLVCMATIACAGGFIVGVSCGIAVQHERTRRDAGGISTHEAARLVYSPPSPAEIVAELRGPLGGRP